MRSFWLTILLAAAIALPASGAFCSALLATYRQQGHHVHLPLLQAAGILQPSCR